ncbi:MAG TPA: family 1 glycosylhydrolase, partial [Enterococcus faecalis]|nr:family 1 glycosylhydrolase [Enterococcus faecalis]
MVKQFKNDFLWGASSSAFQIEGAWNEDGKGLTVADYNSFKKSAVQADTKVASDFYHRFKEDIALMKELGLKTYRFSLSWARIIPTGDGEINQAGIDFYNAVIDTLLENDILPFVTLHHFDTPLALHSNGDFLNRENIDHYVNYADFCFEEFSGRGGGGGKIF